MEAIDDNSPMLPDGPNRSSNLPMYLRLKTRFELTRSSVLLKEKFPMHCITIQDFMSMDRLYDHYTLAKKGKLVVPDKDDLRAVLFISHQWTGCFFF